MSTGLASYVAGFLARELAKRGKKWAVADAKGLGEWRGKADKIAITPHQAALLGYGKITGLYRIVSDPADPLRFYSYRTKLEYRTAMDFVCDLGSIPPFLRGVGGELLDLQPEDFWRSYWLHDGAYDEEGVWVRDPANPASEWVFVDIPRVQADVLMYWGISAEGANNATLQAVYRAVRVGAGFSWRNHRRKDRA